MKRSLSLLLMFTLAFSVPCFAGSTNTQKMEDALAKGYIAVSKGNIEEALKNFDKSTRYANRARSWKGFVDAGNAFCALGSPKRALDPFKKAYKLAASDRDWRGLIAVAYSYASLPEELKGKRKALSALKTARKTAYSKKDWRGLLETAKAYYKLNEKGSANDILISARKIVARLKLGSAAGAFASFARKIEDLPLAAEYSKIAERFGYTGEQAASPPPGWKPYGESAAGPKKISTAAQVAMRRSADKEIASKRRYEAASRKKEKKDYTYYAIYRDYYDHPYHLSYYGYWHPLSFAETYNWANYHLSNYRLVNGIYVYKH